MSYMFLPYKRFVDFSGRSRPLEYWLYILFYMVQIAVAVLIDIQVFGVDYTSYAYYDDGGVSAGFNMNLGPASIIVMVVNLLPSLAVSVRRVHDSDKRGWWILVPIYNLILMCMSGTRGPNRFGPDPLDEGKAQIFS
jgi:uncharacterized membrane protein YhaH (DUF805 family)